MSFLFELKIHRAANMCPIGALFGFCVQFVCNASQFLLKMAGLGRLSNMTARHLWYDKSQALFFVLSMPSEVFSSMLQKTLLCSMGLPWTSAKMCWKRSIWPANRDRRCLAPPYLHSGRPSSFTHSQLSPVSCICRVVRTGKLGDSRWRTSAYILLSSGICCKSASSRTSNGYSSTLFWAGWRQSVGA